MTATRSETTAVQARHPLDPLTADELRGAREVLERSGKLTPGTRFPLTQLDEPAKAHVLAHRAGDQVPRRVRYVLLDVTTGAAAEAVVCLTEGELVTWTDLTDDQGRDGQPPILLEEYDLVQEIVKSDEGWLAAMATRGVSREAAEASLVCPLSAGSFGLAGEKGRRMLRALCFLRDHPDDNSFAHPVDGLVAYVDLIERRVLRVVDTGAVPIPAEAGNFTPAATGPARTTVKPLEITQPEGPSFSVSGSVVTWQNWRFRLGFDQREGAILHQVEIADSVADAEAERYRSVLHRASVAEMVVPYGDPNPTRFWQTYFDVGEYVFGRLANSLVLGCDCLGEIYYFDAVLADDHGHPHTVPNVVCMHEEDYGVLWKHTDAAIEQNETRRARRLVVSFFVTVGNYDYGFYWYFYQDGTIQLEGKATGIVFTSGKRPDSHLYSSELAPGLTAPYHQHLFCARLDMAVDGNDNSVEEVDWARVPMGEHNPYGNAFTLRRTPIEHERDGARMADANLGRTWWITSASRTNRMGKPTAYRLIPNPSPVLLAADESSIARRATFASKHLWVTQHADNERYPTGDLPNQHPGGAGLPAYIHQNRDLRATDVVLWHTFGVSHAPRLEDWPVMPVDYVGFTLRAEGFFDRNPTLDVPASLSRHSGSTQTGSGAGEPGCCH